MKELLKSIPIIRRAWKKVQHGQYLRQLPQGCIESFSARFCDMLDSSSPIVRIATGFRFTEGPVWRRATNSLLFTDIPQSRIYEYDPHRGISVYRSPSGKANGLALDREGRLIVCEHEHRRLTRLDLDGTTAVIASAFGGRRLNSPNDVVVARSGAILFTDPPFGIDPRLQELPVQGVYRVNSKGELILLIDHMDRPNGLALSPDESRLLVADSAQNTVLVFEMDASGAVDTGSLFTDMNTTDKGVTDGLTIDSNGNVFATGPGGIWVLDSEGTHLGMIRLPEQPSNCTLGGPDGRTLFITAKTSVYRVETRVIGATQ